MADARLDNLIAAGLVRPPFEVEWDYKNVHVTAVIEQNGESCSPARLTIRYRPPAARKGGLGGRASAVL